MKKTVLSLLVVVAVLGFGFVPKANVAPLEPFGKIELFGGGEKEHGAPSGGRFSMEALGVLPIFGNFGAQGAIHYETGLGSRIGFNVAPVLGWDGGKAGFFVNYQHRGLRDTDFVWLIPSIALYLPQWNLNMWYSQPVTGAQHGGGRTEYAINKLQFTAKYYPARDWMAPWLRRDNVELEGGLQVNTFAGAGHSKMGGTGVGPVLGLSFLPMPGVTVDVVKATFDSEGRYRVNTGLEFFFDRGGTSLKDMRRKYLEPGKAETSGGKKGLNRSHERFVNQGKRK
jgi:hypothetical protein